ncbi:phenylacetate--CoA ligase family protein [Candidatus Desantisbacteria bacterium]|nr:phenylacetate--CoA ligase family protein [Candidatus Desantisbacteria bacterium]
MQCQNWDKMKKDDILKLQGNRLHHFLNTMIYPYSPYYRDLFQKNKISPEKIKMVEDLKNIPFTTKVDIAPTLEDPQKYKSIILQPNADNIRKYAPVSKKIELLIKKIIKGEDAVKLELTKEFMPISLFFTTGRTALPTAFALSLFDTGLLQTIGERIVKILDLDSYNDRGLNMFPYAPHLAFWQVVFSGWGGGVLLLSTGGGKVAGTEGNIMAIEKFKPSLLIGIPGYVYHILRQAEQEGHKFNFVTKVALGGEKVSQALKEKIRNILNNMGGHNTKVMSVLGFTEARKCWTECPSDISTGFHTYPDLEIFEIINPETGEVLDEGMTGELVYTCLEGRGSCVIRYRTGDIIEGGITYEKCPGCGRTLPRISTKLSRVSNIKDLQLSKVKGNLVNLNLFIHILSENHDIEEWQIVLKKKNNDPFELDEVLIYLSVKKGIDIENLRRTVNDKFIDETEVHPNEIIITTLDDMLHRLGMDTKLKEERILDLRK